MKFTELEDSFGHDVAKKICDELGGDTVYIPVNKASTRGKILSMWGAGSTIDLIAERVGCSKSWVCRVVKQ